MPNACEIERQICYKAFMISCIYIYYGHSQCLNSYAHQLLTTLLHKHKAEMHAYAYSKSTNAEPCPTHSYTSTSKQIEA